MKVREAMNLSKDAARAAVEKALREGKLVGERLKDAPKGQQSTVFILRTEQPSEESGEDDGERRWTDV